jgi:putative transposase
MARLPRMIIPGQPQHIIVRSNNRSGIFCCDADYRFYLENFRRPVKKHDCQVSNHAKLI